MTTLRQQKDDTNLRQYKDWVMTKEWDKIRKLVEENPDISLSELLERLEVVIEDQIESRMITNIEWLHEE